jgi:hypothetical protein
MVHEKFLTEFHSVTLNDARIFFPAYPYPKLEAWKWLSNRS